MLHAIWDNGLVVFGWRGRVLDLRTVTSFASTLFVSRDRLEQVRLQLVTPGRGADLNTVGLRIPTEVAADAFRLRDWVPWSQLSPSLAWIRAVNRLADNAVTARLAVPSLTPTGRAGWRPIITETVGKELAHLTATMPPVLTSAGLAPWQVTSLAIDAFVDDAARRQLYDIEIPDPAPGSRRAADVIARRFLHALTDDGQVSAPTPAERAMLTELSAEVERWSARATGRSPLAGLGIVLRVVAPEDVLDADIDSTMWMVEVLVHPADDPSQLRAVDDLDAADVASAAVRRVADRAPLLGLDPSLPTSASLPIDELFAFLRNDTAKLEAVGIRVLLPSWWKKPARARTAGAATPVETPVVAAGLDAASLATIDWSVALDDTKLTVPELERLAESKHELVFLRGRWTTFDRSQVERAIANMLRRRSEAEEVGPLALMRLSADDDVTIEGTGWTDELLAGLPDDRLTPLDEPAAFNGTLRPYQRRGLGWLAFLTRLGLGGCLADDMGLGKTAQLLALLVHERESDRAVGPTLVVCPLSVVRNWEAETERFTPTLTIAVHHGPDRLKGDDFKVTTDIVVTTYATASRDVATLAKVGWERLVADEAQHVKNAETSAAKALRRIRARQKLALTGTPVENRLSDLWAVTDLVNPGLLDTASRFRERFAVPIERNRNLDRTDELRQLVQPFMLRRSKADRSLVPELPEKLEQIAWAQLTREQATLYQSVVDVLLSRLDAMKGMRNSIDRRGTILAALTRLKQICNHPVHYLADGGRLSGRSGKLTRFDELVDDALDADERMLVFTQFREMGTLLQRHLIERAELDAPFLHGGVAKAARDRMVDRFQSAEGSPIFIVSLKAGGSGLNLTAASRVVHYDRWWNPAVENQASDRAWRIGQTRAVLVNKMVCQGTIEDRIDQLIESKRDLADRVVGSGEGWITEMSTDELRDLIVLRAGAHQ